MIVTREHRTAPAGFESSRRIGRFALVSLLARSARTLAWRARDLQQQQDRILMMPRQPPASPQGLHEWLPAARRAARLTHPQLVPPCEVSSQGGWPYVVYDASEGETLDTRLQAGRLQPREAASLVASLARAVTHAHECGLVHGDLQAPWVLVDASGRARLLGLQVPLLPLQHGLGGNLAAGAEGATEAGLLHRQRLAAQRDVVSLGLLLHHALGGRPPLDETDVGAVLDRLPPAGREMVRLPWNTPGAIPAALRAIANRATDRQPRQRYRSARTMAHALEGYLLEEASPGAGALARMRDRLGTAGALPSRDAMASGVARLALLERGRTRELAQLVIDDVSLTLELIRRVNTAVVRGTRVSDSGSVLTVRRAIALLGVAGVRRAAMCLPPGPAAADDGEEPPLHVLLERCAWASRLAQELRPPQWDPEVVAVVTMLQNLGRLMVQFHLPADAAQIGALVSPVSRGVGSPDEPGMSEHTACCAVLGVDMEAVGRGLVRHWGLGDDIARWVRRVPAGAAVPTPQADEEFLRTLGSCANEAVDAACLAPHRAHAALARVARRYAEPLGVGLAALGLALDRSRSRPAQEAPKRPTGDAEPDAGESSPRVEGGVTSLDPGTGHDA